MNALTELKEGLLISWDAIRANKMRSVLTTLGIVIGILTVTLMGTADRRVDPRLKVFHSLALTSSMRNGLTGRSIPRKNGLSHKNAGP